MRAKSLVEKRLRRIKAKAGFRHPIERAVDTTMDLPLDEALLRLREMTEGKTPPVPGAARFIREVLQQSGSSATAYSEKAAWSWAARLAVGRRVTTGREQELVDLLEPVDCTRLHSELSGGRGLILVGAHLGVPGAARRALTELLPDFRAFVGEERWTSYPGKNVAMRDAHSKKTSLVASAAFLRQGGALYAAVDGKQVSTTARVVLFGQPRPVGRGLAALARISRAPSIPVAGLWTSSCRIRLAFGGLLPEATQHAADEGQAWEASWLQEWARWFESLIRDDPENTRFSGGLWHDSEGGLLR